MDVGTIVVSIASAAVGVLIGGRITEVAQNRSRAIRARQVSLALLADIDRLRRELPQPSHDLRFPDVPAVHPRLRAVVVAMIKIDPSTHAAYVHLDDAIATRTKALFSYNAASIEYDRHKDFIERAELERKLGIADSPMQTSGQEQASRQGLPARGVDLAATRETFERSDGVFRSSLADLAWRLNLTAERRVPSLSPWDDENGEWA